MDRLYEFDDEEERPRNRNRDFLLSQNTKTAVMTQRSDQTITRERGTAEDTVSKLNRYKAETAKLKKENEEMKQEIQDLKKQKMDFDTVTETLKLVVEKLDNLEKRVASPPIAKTKTDDRHLVSGDDFKEIFPTLEQIQGKDRYRRPDDHNRIYYKKGESLYNTSRFLCKNFPNCQQPTARGTICEKCQLKNTTDQGIPNTLTNIINNNQ